MVVSVFFKIVVDPLFQVRFEQLGNRFGPRVEEGRELASNTCEDDLQASNRGFWVRLEDNVDFPVVREDFKRCVALDCDIDGPECLLGLEGCIERVRKPVQRHEARLGLGFNCHGVSQLRNVTLCWLVPVHP
ncbi:hypothetical protein D3C85_707780 [compost metagenome]